MRQPVAGHQAFVVARHAGAADDRPHGVDPAADMDAELSLKRRTAIVLAAHAAEICGDILGGNPCQFLVRFQRKSRPLLGIAATGAATLAIEIFGGNDEGHGA